MNIGFVVKALSLLALPLLVLPACGDDEPASAADADAPAEAPDALRLGYFPNITHAPAIVGVERGIFQDHLGDVALKTQTFDAGPAAIEALFAGGIDASFIGPNPAINGFAKSDGKALRIVAGTTSGGAFLVVADDIDGPEDLRGKKVASPQLANTQDVALRAWLADNALEADTAGGGDVSIIPQPNADTLTAFQAGEIAGAWVPEPWATRLVQEGGGKVLVDEKDLWRDGKFVTTHLIVATEYLEQHPQTVKALLEGLVESIDTVNDDPATAQKVTNEGIGRITTKPLKDEVITAAWENLEFTWDPVASSLAKSAEDAEAAGLLDPVDLDGIYDLALLNEILDQRGEEPVEGL